MRELKLVSPAPLLQEGGGAPALDAVVRHSELMWLIPSMSPLSPSIRVPPPAPPPPAVSSGASLVRADANHGGCTGGVGAELTGVEPVGERG